MRAARRTACGRAGSGASPARGSVRSSLPRPLPEPGASQERRQRPAVLVARGRDAVLTRALHAALSAAVGAVGAEGHREPQPVALVVELAGPAADRREERPDRLVGEQPRLVVTR